MRQEGRKFTASSERGKSKVALVRGDCGKPNMKFRMYNAKAATETVGTYVSNPVVCKIT